MRYVNKWIMEIVNSELFACLVPDTLWGKLLTVCFGTVCPPFVGQVLDQNVYPPVWSDLRGTTKALAACAQAGLAKSVPTVRSHRFIQNPPAQGTNKQFLLPVQDIVHYPSQLSQPSRGIPSRLTQRPLGVYHVLAVPGRQLGALAIYPSHAYVAHYSTCCRGWRSMAVAQLVT